MSTTDPGNGEGGAAAPSGHRFCTSCGHPATGSRFCGNCGAAVPAAVAPAAVTPSAVDTQDTVALPHVPAEPPAPAALAPRTDQATEVLEPSTGSDGLDALPWVEPPYGELAAPAQVGARDGAGTRRNALIAAGSILGLLALVAAGVLGSRYYADGDLRQALASSSRAFNGAVEAFSRAADAEQVTDAASEAGSAAGRVDRALRDLGPVSGPKDGAVRAQLEAEKGVLVALGQLDGLAREPLASWGDAHTELTGAVETEDRTRAALARLRSDDARDLADTSLMLSKVTAAVGPALVDDATAESARLLKTLGQATSTADLRELGDAAAAEQSAVAAAAQALPEGDGKQVLSGYASALSALGELAKINGESTSSWTATRADLAQTFGQVAAAAGSTGGSSVRVVLNSSLQSADEVVASAAAAIADWKVKTEAAVKARTTDAEALASYASFFRSQVKTYEQLREDLSAFTKRVEDPGVYYYEAYSFMSQAEQDRRDVRDVLVSTDVPEDMGAAHQDVVAAIDRAIGAVQSAYDGLSQSQDCYDDCPYYRDTPGWQRFLSESDGISKAYAAAMRRWEAAVTATKAQIANRPLPPKPDV